MSTSTLPRDRADEDQQRISPLLRRRTAWLVALLPLLVAVALIVGMGEGSRERTSLDNLPEGYDSTLGHRAARRAPRRGRPGGGGAVDERRR